MSLTGMHTNLRRFRDHYCRSIYLKEILNVAVRIIDITLRRFKYLPENVEKVENKSNYPTWHSMFNPN